MKKRNLFFILSIIWIFISCGTGLKISKEKLLIINSNFKETFINASHKTTTIKTGIKRDSDILTLLNLENKKSDVVTISFSSKNELIIQYKDTLGSKTEYLQGKFSNRGYYEIYLRKKNIQIPPLIPLLYSKIDIDRIRISLTKENDLIIDNYFSRGGNIFLLSGGGSTRHQYYFKQSE